MTAGHDLLNATRSDSRTCHASSINNEQPATTITAIEHALPTATATSKAEFYFTRRPTLTSASYSRRFSALPRHTHPQTIEPARAIVQRVAYINRCLPRRCERAEQGRSGALFPIWTPTTTTGRGQGATSQGGKTHFKQRRNEVSLPRVTQRGGDENEGTNSNSAQRLASINVPARTRAFHAPDQPSLQPGLGKSKANFGVGYWSQNYERLAMLSYAFFVKVDVDEEWVAHEYLRRCKVGAARESEQDEELWNRSSAGIWNEHIIEAELVGAPRQHFQQAGAQQLDCRFAHVRGPTPAHRWKEEVKTLQNQQPPTKGDK
ncbi:hypothetical protein THAOC_29354, partial [Thalassiosira oceanica]